MVANRIRRTADSTLGEPTTGDIVFLALPYPALADVVGQYAAALDGKVVVDITNPVDFATFERRLLTGPYRPSRR